MKTTHMSFIVITVLFSSVWSPGCSCKADLSPLPQELSSKMSPDVVDVYEKIRAGGDTSIDSALNKLSALGLTGKLTSRDFELVPYLLPMTQAGSSKQRFQGLSALRPFVYAAHRDKVATSDDASHRLVKSRATKALNACSELLTDSNAEVRVAAIKCHDDVHQKRIISLMLERLADDSWLARYEALSNLLVLLDVDSENRIPASVRPLLLDPHKQVKEMANNVLNRAAKSQSRRAKTSPTKN